MGKGRVESFSDGVIAVAITLLALNLTVPSPLVTHAGTLAHRLLRQWPEYAAYVVSFVTIGIIWINHHAMLRRLSSVDHMLLVLNLLLLLTIVVLPFSTALMAEYLKASAGARTAAAVYGGSLLLMSCAFFTAQRYVLVVRRHLLREQVTDAMRRTLLRRNAMGLAPYAIATIAALVSPYVTLAVCGAVAVFYALPSTSSDTVGLGEA